MTTPISPAPVTRHEPDYLPPFVSNGVIGLRVREIPLHAGVASVSGLSGIDPVTQIVCAPYAPYPIAGDIKIGMLSMSDIPHAVRFIEQSYDFTCGELTSRFEFESDGTTADVEVLTFCSRTLPSLVLQEIAVTLNQAADVTLSAIVDPRNISGDWEHRWTSVPGEETELVDGTMAWRSHGDIATIGVSYSTEFLGDGGAERSTNDEERAPLGTQYAFRARTGRRYQLRQIAAMVPSAAHHQPEAEAIRLVAEGCLTGFDSMREKNQEAWAEIWKSRIVLHGADRRWQALADAALVERACSAWSVREFCCASPLRLNRRNPASV